MTCSERPRPTCGKRIKAEVSSASKQSYELFNGESGVGNDATERAGSELPVRTTTLCLTAEDESGALQGGADLAAR
jgi:hypothetical protein